MNKTIQKSLLLLCAAVASLSSVAQPTFTHYPHDLSYFTPKSLNIEGKEVALSGKFNGEVPTPKQVLGFELGERYCEWSDILNYVDALAAQSNRVRLVELGRTHEKRRLVQLIITSEKNQANLEQIKADHLKLINASQSAEAKTAEMPIVANITCSMHGDETSGAHASMAIAYLLAASEDEAVTRMLDNMVLLLVPGSNPDGLNRYTSWVNNSLGALLSGDNNSLEHKQAWPGARSNHYYANANRDLLMCQHPEGRITVEQYLDWHPNLVIDLHEMGGNKARFFHSPGHPKRLHQYVTAENQALTGEVGAYVKSALEPIGADPYSGTSFDDYYLGKGAAYGDIQGSVCLLFEQSSARGYSRLYENGYMTLPTTIRNQAEASLAALCAGYDMREKLLNYQRDFFQKSAAAAQQSEVQGYIFHARGDKARAYRLLENLMVHNIEVYHLAKDTKVGKENFTADESFIIPLNQRYFYKVKAVWERLGRDIYEDLHFYDISTWTFPLAYNVAQAEVKSVEGLVGALATLSFPQGAIIGGKSDKGYVINSVALYSHNLLGALMSKGVSVKVAEKPFKVGKATMECGSAIVSLENQPLSGDEIYALLEKAAAENGADVYAIDNRFKEDKLTLRELQQPKVVLLVGEGFKGDTAGEIWMMLEKHYGIAPTRLTAEAINKKSIANYNVMIAPHGAMPKKDKAYPAIRRWVESGGTLITTGSGFLMNARAGLPPIKRLPAPTAKGDAEKIAGAILNCKLDISSPLGYGYTTDELPIFRKTPKAYDEESLKDYIIPMRYTAKPHLSGYISQSNIDRIASTAAAIVVKCGEGRVIHLVDSPVFRSYWFGGAKLFMNSIYFGQLY